MPNSKPYLAFKNKVAKFNADLEFVDIVHHNLCVPEILGKADLFPGVKDEKYPVLSKYKNVPKNRLLVVTHLKTTIYTAYIKDLYEEFTIYLRGILREAYEHGKIDPGRITGEHNPKIDSASILRYYLEGNLVEMVIDDIFQGLESERSTIELINKFHNKIGLEKDDSTIAEAVKFLEMRHILVHADGIASSEYRQKHTDLDYTDGGKIKLGYGVVCAAKQAVFNLVEDLDSKVMEKGLASNSTEKRNR